VPSSAEPSSPVNPTEMAAVYLRGYGDFDQLDYVTDAPVPTPGPDDVLIKVAAAGINNTDINTRIGWYARDDDDGGGWAGDLGFPRIQGADCCGHIVATGANVDAKRVGERVLVTTMQRHPAGDVPWKTTVFGSEYNGGFAQYATTHHAEAFAVKCDWTDIELASIPCAYSTAENMLQRIGLGRGDTTLITGASGGVGSAAVQLAKRRGAHVIAVSGSAKAAAVAELGADEVVDRNEDLLARFGENAIDVIVDIVAGPAWQQFTRLLRVGGRYVTAGAIAGPIVELDIRDLYLKDLTLKGSTYQEEGVFENLIGYIEAGEIRPVIAATYPLSDIVDAQKAFLDKGYVGKIVLVHPT